MQFSTLLKLLAFVHAGQAFTIPPNIPEGVYSVATDTDGDNLITRLNDRSRTPLSWTQKRSIAPEASLNKRLETLKILETRDTGTKCGCGFGLDHGNCDAAVDNLSRQLDQTNPTPDHAYYSIAGSGATRVVAFLCRFVQGSQWNYVSGHTYGDQLKRVSANCGQYTAGTFWDNVNQFASGYMRYADGANFCVDSLSSPASSC